MTSSELPLEAIRLGKRYRQNLGDVDALAKSIASLGLLHPVVVTPAGELIAGQRRLEACRRLGWDTVPVRVVDLEQIVLGQCAENNQRKNFAPSEAVAIGRAIEEIEAARARERQATGWGNHSGCANFAQPGEKVKTRDIAGVAVGLSGWSYQKAKQIIDAAESDPETFGDLPEQMDKSGKVDRAHKEFKRRKRQKELEERIAAAEEDTANAFRLLCGDFREACKGLERASIDAIVTDPPYGANYIPLYGNLAQHAACVLKPGGTLAVMTGQSYLPEVLGLMLQYLRYHWTLAYLLPGGQSAQAWQRKVNTFWKPVVWLVNGEYGGKWIGDVARSDDNDKRFHKSGQSTSGMVDLMRRLTEPGDLVLDPFAGACTTGVAALQLGRRFIGMDIDQAALGIGRARLVEVASERSQA